MQTTSHFVWIEMNPKLFSDIFVNVYKYLKENDVLEAVNMQNPLSPHITLYYLEGNLLNADKDSIKNDISVLDISDDIYFTWINYFFRGENRFVLYFTTQTQLPLKDYRDSLHKKYNRVNVEDNSFEFSPHVTFLRILDSKIFENHRINIESIILSEVKKLKMINISNKKVWLYAVNSTYREEIQIKL